MRLCHGHAVAAFLEDEIGAIKIACEGYRSDADRHAAAWGGGAFGGENVEGLRGGAGEKLSREDAKNTKFEEGTEHGHDGG